MNWGVMGVLLASLALGVGVGGCWRFGTSFVARYTPILLAVIYYAAMFIWPYPPVRAWVEQKPYPEGEQFRWMLFGITLLIVVVELISRLHRATQNNKKLREKLNYQREFE